MKALEDTKSYKNRLVLVPGALEIYRRADTDSEMYYAKYRLRQPNGKLRTFRESLGTKVESDAKERAADRYYVGKVTAKKGQSFAKRSFNELMESFLDSLDDDAGRSIGSRTTYRTKHERFLRGFWKDLPDIKEIDQQWIRRYWVYRQDYWKNVNPGRMRDRNGKDRCVFHVGWTGIPAERGHSFQAKVITYRSEATPVRFVPTC